jgi:hypothetical protein
MNWLRIAITMIAAMIAAPSVFAQPAVEWVRTFANSPANVPLIDVKTVSVADGSTFVSGLEQAAFSGDLVRVVSKISASGQLLWSRRIAGRPLADSGDNRFMTPLTDGGVVVLSQAANSSRPHLVKLNATGNVAWSREVGAWTFGATVLAGLSGSIYTVSDIVVKLDSDGAVLWQTAFNSSILKARLAPDGALLVQSNQQIARFNATDGSKSVLSNISSIDFVSGNSGVTLALEFGNFLGFNVANRRVRAINESGVTLWTRDFVFPNSNNGSPWAQLFAGPNGGVYLAHRRDNEPYMDIVLVQATGTVTWNRNYYLLSSVFMGGGGLNGVRYEQTSSGGVNSVFPIAAATGDLGAPAVTTTNNPAQELSNWSYSSGLLTATATFGTPQRLFSISSTGAVVWGSELARFAPELRVDRTSCLMPRLVLSSPSRSNSFVQRGATPSDASFYATNGNGSDAGSTDSGSHCATALEDSGNTYRATTSNLARFNADGTNQWNASVSSSSFDGMPKLVLRAANGDIFTAGQGVMTRHTDAGVSIWSTSYNQQSGSFNTSRAAYIFEDSTGNVLVAGPPALNSEPWAVKVSATGSIIYRQALGTPACQDDIAQFAGTPSGELLLASTSCNEGRVFKYAANGTLLWQRTVSGTFDLPYVRLTSLVVSASGEAFVGGCAGTSLYGTGLMSASAVQTFTASGNENWKRIEDFVSSSNECVSALSLNGTRLLVGIESDRATRASYLISLNASDGTEAFRSFSVLQSPSVAISDIASLGGSRILALGSASSSESDGRSVASVRSIDLSLVASTRAAFVSTPQTSVERLKPFTVTVGLRDSNGAPFTATAITRIYVQAEGSAPSATVYCDVPVGQVSCVVSGVRMYRTGTGQRLIAETDGGAPVTSSPFDVTAASTTTLITVLTAAPYKAYDRIRVRVDVQGEIDETATGVNGFLNLNLGVGSCADSPIPAGYILRRECDLTAQVGMTLSANFQSYSTEYLSSSSTPLALSVQPIAVTLAAASFPAPNTVVGTRTSFSASIFDSNGVNVSQFFQGDLVLRDGSTTLCSMYLQSNRFTCDYQFSLTGTRNLTVSLSQVNPNFSSVQDATLTINVVSGLSLIGTIYGISPANASLCATAPGADCDVDSSTGRYACVLPNGWSGAIIPQATALDITFNPPAIRVNGEAGQIPRDFSANTVGQRGCIVDVDANGIVEPTADGLFILRAMLGITPSVNELSTVGACARRTGATRTTLVNDQIATRQYDFDGDGFVKPETDGLLLLRAALGFTGNSVTNGVVGANAARSDWGAIRSYMQSACGMLLQ